MDNNQVIQANVSLQSVMSSMMKEAEGVPAAQNQTICPIWGDWRNPTEKETS